ncbi:uncharacterized protein [Dysidea avara]
MAGLSSTSELSASQQGSSQCLPPLVDELQLHNMTDCESEDMRDSPTGSEKHPSTSETPSVASNEPQLVDNYCVDGKLCGQPTTTDHQYTSDMSACNVRRLRNGKAVVLSGNHRGKGLGDAKKHSGECNLSSLPSEDTHYTHGQCHNGHMESSQEETEGQKWPSKKKAGKRSQTAEKGAVYPTRVTRSKTKLMTQNDGVDNEAPVVPSLDAPHSSRDQTMDDTETNQKILTSKAQIKYNKSTGCSRKVKDANYSTSERHLLTTNNRAKNSIPQQNGCLNGSHQHQHTSGLPSEEISQPLSDVTNSTCDDIFGDVPRPSFIHSSSQNRVYQLVAGKKNKKTRKQQPRKTAMHGKKHGTGGDAENHPTSDQDTASSQASTQGDQHDNCLRQCHHRKASQHIKTSGEDGDITTMACSGRSDGICDMFSEPHSITTNSNLPRHR